MFGHASLYPEDSGGENFRFAAVGEAYEGTGNRMVTAGARMQALSISHLARDVTLPPPNGGLPAFCEDNHLHLEVERDPGGRGSVTRTA